MRKTDDEIEQLIEDLRYPGLRHDAEFGMVVDPQKPSSREIVDAFLAEG